MIASTTKVNILTGLKAAKSVLSFWLFQNKQSEIKTSL
jgi:hypothetical protein